jgi:antitoxin MazE
MAKAIISKWGNSSAIRLPKAAMAELGLKDGSVVRIERRDGTLVILPERPKVPTLREMYEEMDRIGWQNEPELVDWGPDVGSEIIDDSRPS